MIDSKSHAGLDLLHEAMAARVAKGELPGMVTLVAHGDDARVDTIGVMAFGSDEPMRRDTIFRITSMTKPILALATMMLVEDGRLGLDEPADRLLPELVQLLGDQACDFARRFVFRLRTGHERSDFAAEIE